MSRVLAVAVALSAILFVTYALPYPYEEPAAEETTVAPTEATTANAACEQYKQQCSGGQNGAAPIQSGVGGGMNNIPGMGGYVNQTQGAMPDQCAEMEKACQQNPGGGAMTTPGAGVVTGAPGGYTPPGQLPTNGSMPGMPPTNGSMPGMPPAPVPVPTEVPYLPGGMPAMPGK